MKVKLIKDEEGYSLFTKEEGSNNRKIIATTEGIYVKQKLSKQNCDEIFGVVDVDKLAMGYELYEKINFVGQTRAYKAGFNKSIELNKDKVFTLEDIKKAIVWAHDKSTEGVYLSRLPVDEFIQSLQQPTEMDVEIVYERDCYSSAGRCDKSTMSQCIICTPVYPLEDENGCLILKRAK